MIDREMTERLEGLYEPRFRALVENISDAIALLGADGTIVYSGPSTTRILGYDVSENVGRNAFELVHPEDRDAARQRFGELLATPGATAPLAYRLLHRDGTWRDMEGIAKNLLHEPGIRGLVVTYRDVTERVRWEEALRESEERYRSVVAALDEGIIVHDASGTITAMNESAARILALSPERLIGRSTTEMDGSTFYEDGSPFPSEEFPGSVALETGQPQRGVVMGIDRPDGTRTWITINALPLCHAGATAPYGAVASFTDVTERKRFEARLMHAAHHDALTRLPNRTLFMDRLAQLVARAKRRKHYRFALLFLDFDSFKSVNDTFGHALGDALLVAIAERLRHCLREHDIVARLAGDEFAIIVEEVDGAAAALEIAARLHDALVAPFAFKRTTLRVTASIGIALSATGYRNPEDLLRDADTAMYRAKADGRGQSAIADAAMRERLGERHQMEAEIRAAVARDELETALVPVVHLATGEIAGYELHLDWRRSSEGSATPAEFLHDAEESGLCAAVDLWLIRSACRRLRAWQRDGAPSTAWSVTVPVHGSTLVHPTFMGDVADALRATGATPTRLIVQVREGILTERVEAAAALANLESRGVGIQIDGFGAGQESLFFLRHFPITTLKLARTFIQMLEHEFGCDIVRAAIALAHTLRMRVIADGVETERQRTCLIEAGCDFAVGAGAPVVVAQ